MVHYPKRLFVSQEVETMVGLIQSVSQRFCRLRGVMNISHVKRQGLAGLNRRLGLTRRRGLGRAGFKFKLNHGLSESLPTERRL
jgi:hypothetical protein